MPNILKPQTTPQNPYVIVSKPGQDDQEVVSEFPTLEQAMDKLDDLKKDGNDDFDVMKRQDDGSPTCDY